jgi:CubicO group peptidase (beta-lactamase class C family)
MVEAHGFCDERFTPVRDQFAASLNDGTDEGASYAIDVNGNLALDLWGGYRDVARTQPWEPDTLVGVASTTKVVTTIATLMCWDRGLLELDVPIANYWPDFAQNGKAAITTRQVLTQRAGVPGFGRKITTDDTADFDHMIGIVEQAPLSWEPGTLMGYHQLTYGYILGGLLQRVVGASLEDFVDAEITGPLGADFHYTLRGPADIARVSEIWIPPGVSEGSKVGDDTAIGMQALAEFADILEPIFLKPAEFVSALNPGGVGMANARAIARIGSIISGRGEVDGHRYLSTQAVDEAVREQCHADDVVLGARIRRGLFFALDDDPFHAPTPTAVHWGGFGGSWVTMDPATGITCAYAPNRYCVGEEMLVRQAAQWMLLSEVLASTS